VLAVEALQEELIESQGDRVRADVEAQRQVRALEESFEQLVHERDSELSALRRTHVATIQENETLRQQLEAEKTLNRGLQARGRNEEMRGQSVVSPLLLSLLDALWQVTSDSKQALVTLQGAPKLLELIGDAVGEIQRNIVACPAANNTSLLPPHSSDCKRFQHLPGLCGVLVNMAATSDGRRALAETMHGELLRKILQMINDIRDLEINDNKIQQERGTDAHLETFSRESARNATTNRSAQDTQEIVADTKQLLLCIVSNLCTDKTIAIKLIEAGMVEKMIGVFKSEKNEPLRRYAVSIVKSTLEFVQYLGVSDHSNPNGRTETKMACKAAVPSRGDVYAKIGDLITMLSKESNMKMVGLELLGELQRVMPMED